MTAAEVSAAYGAVAEAAVRMAPELAALAASLPFGDAARIELEFLVYCVERAEAARAELHAGAVAA